MVDDRSLRVKTPIPTPFPQREGNFDAVDLLSWYDRHRRELPWRARQGETSDPYKVWLSEIMLQQTTVKAVIPYFQKFVARWPTVVDLASAHADDVMKAWAGLGYYSRARNLVACAEKVAAKGSFPNTENELRALPGIGAYTAAAIAAIAFGERATVVDGNIERVITRLHAIETALPKAKPEIRAYVDKLTPANRPGDFAQAMMDLGATICTPRKPACGLCPFMANCKARTLGLQEAFPRKLPKRERPLRRGAAFWAERADGFILVRKRPDKGLLGGMTEIPSSPWSIDFDLENATIHAPFAAKWRRLPSEASHGFTHFELLVTVFAVKVPASTPAPHDCHWVALDSLDDEALPTAMRKVVAVAREATYRLFAT